MAAEQNLFSDVRVDRYKRGGYTVYAVTFPTPESAPEAYFAAIVHKDFEPHEHMTESPSTRYFVLEKTEGSAPPFLCEWYRDGSRLNYGQGTPPELEAFVDSVFARINGSIPQKSVKQHLSH